MDFEIENYILYIVLLRFDVVIWTCPCQVRTVKSSPLILNTHEYSLSNTVIKTTPGVYLYYNWGFGGCSIREYQGERINTISPNHNQSGKDNPKKIRENVHRQHSNDWQSATLNDQTPPTPKSLKQQGYNGAAMVSM